MNLPVNKRLDRMHRDTAVRTGVAVLSDNRARRDSEKIIYMYRSLHRYLHKELVDVRVAHTQRTHVQLSLSDKTPPSPGSGQVHYHQARSRKDSYVRLSSNAHF